MGVHMSGGAGAQHNSQGAPMHAPTHTGSSDGSNQGQRQICIRNGCANSATTNSEWDEEYCSGECVVTHCRQGPMIQPEPTPYKHLVRCFWR